MRSSNAKQLSISQKLKEANSPKKTEEILTSHNFYHASGERMNQRGARKRSRTNPI